MMKQQGAKFSRIIVCMVIVPETSEAFPCHCKSAKFSTFRSPSYYWAVLKRDILGPAIYMSYLQML